MEHVKAMSGKATFVMDRGYDDNKMFLKKVNHLKTCFRLGLLKWPIFTNCSYNTLNFYTLRLLYSLCNIEKISIFI